MSATPTVDAVKLYGGFRHAARALGLHHSTVADRYAKEMNIDPAERTLTPHPDCNRVVYDHPITAIAFSDAHIWPGEFSPAFYILCDILEHVQPDLVIDGGDFFDGASISRHPPGGWEKRPSVKEELDACLEASGLIFNSSPESDHMRIPGNHGDRIAKYLATHASQFEAMPGTTLEDYFTGWTWAKSHLINEAVLVTHNWKGGYHAGHNNTLWSGVSTLTGHDHMLKCYPLDDLRGRRWGVHMGTLQNIYGPQFAYMEHRPRMWASGFVYLEILPDGRLYPETIHVESDGTARWRGRVWRG